MDWKNKTENIINKVKFQFHAKGIDDLESLRQYIESFDPTHCGYLDYNEFNKMISKMGIFLTSQEMSCVQREFDPKAEERIPYLDFIQKIRVTIADKRLDIVKQAFRFLDQGNRGIVPIDQMIKQYRAEEHPRVRTRAKPVDVVRDEFARAISAKSRDGRTIREEDFIEYYLDINATLPPEKDLYFVDLVFRTWGMSAEAGYITQERLAHLENILYEKIRQRTVGSDDEGKTVRKAFKYFDLEDKGVITLPQFAAALGSFGCTFAQGETVALFNRFDKDHSGKIVFDEFANFFALMGAGTNKNLNPVFQLTREIPSDIVNKIKEENLKRGSFGISGLGRILRRCDKFKSGNLNRAEFAWGLKENGHTLTKFELDKLYRYFDKNCDDQVKYIDFLNLIRGEMTEKRAQAINEVTGKLDVNGTGKLPAEVLKRSVDGSGHPLVRKGVKRPEEINREILSQFDNLNKDGFVTAEEFVEFARNFAGSFETDDDFVGAFRSCWGA